MGGKSTGVGGRGFGVGGGGFGMGGRGFGVGGGGFGVGGRGFGVGGRTFRPIFYAAANYFTPKWHSSGSFVKDQYPPPKIVFAQQPSKKRHF